MITILTTVLLPKIFGESIKGVLPIIMFLFTIVTLGVTEFIITKKKKQRERIDGSNIKIVAILGSPHSNGNGAVALESVLAGAKENGAECLQYNLYKLKINNCLGCRQCVQNGGICVIKDDFTEIFENIKTADTVIISSPIYINQVNGYTKTFLDRLYPLTDEHHKPRFGKRNVIMLCTYGAPIPFIFSQYIRSTGKSLKAMGLINKQNIVIHGCTTLDKMKKDAKLQSKIKVMGKKL